jgi:hypothetical protein
MKLCIAALCLAAAVAGCKGDAVKCDQACRNYFTLLYWADADPKIASAPPAERDAMRKQLLAEFDAKMTRGVDVCSTKCVSADDEKDTDCMIEAKTPAAVKACVTE